MISNQCMEAYESLIYLAEKTGGARTSGSNAIRGIMLACWNSEDFPLDLNHIRTIKGSKYYDSAMTIFDDFLDDKDPLSSLPEDVLKRMQMMAIDELKIKKELLKRKFNIC